MYCSATHIICIVKELVSSFKRRGGPEDGSKVVFQMELWLGKDGS
jgi:hypothetical protein